MKREDVIRSEIRRAFASQVRNYEWSIVKQDGNFFKVIIELKESIGEVYAIEQIDLSKIIYFKQRIEKKDFRMFPWRIISRSDKLAIVVQVRSNIPVEDE